MRSIPRFENEFLEDVADSLRKRLKAISHQASRIDGQKVYETVGSAKEEKFEIYLAKTSSRNGPRIRVNVWADRWISVDAREPSPKGVKGWLWEWTTEGRLMGGLGGKEIVQALEAGISSLYQIDKDRVHKFDEIWRPILARGPVEVRQ
jgi:hypothetical protein